MLNHLRSTWCLCGLLLCLLWGGAAWGKADPFKEHYDKALEFYKGGQLEDAIVEFQAAYAIRQMPKLLLNLGQVHRKLGHAREALGFYEFYLRVEPNPKPEIKTEVEAYISQAKAMIAAAERVKDEYKQRTEENAAEAAPAPSEAPAPAAPPAPAPPPVQAAPAPQPVPAAALVSTQTAPPKKKRWPMWVGIGVAAGAVVAGAVIAGAVLGSRPGEPMLALENAR